MNRNNEIKVFGLEDAQTGDTEVSAVYVSNDYSSFETFKGNREPDHVGMIVASMIEYGAIDKPIICTTDPERPKVKIIADGNNSFNARMQLGLPIYYVLLENLTEREMIALNLTNRNWTKKNYVEFYAQKGYADYMIFKNLMDEFPEFTCSTIEAILRLSLANDGRTDEEKNNGQVSAIARGIFKCKDTKRSRELINLLMKIKKTEGQRANLYRQDHFVRAMIRCFNFKPFEGDRFVKKIEMFPFLFTKQPDTQGYIEMIERIYNYHQKIGFVSFGELKFRKS
jgi:hypothetical protein